MNCTVNALTKNNRVEKGDNYVNKHFPDCFQENYMHLTYLHCYFQWQNHLISSHLSRNGEGRWGTTDDLASSFLHFPLFSTTLWDLANSRPVHSLMLSSHLFLCLPCLLPPFIVPCKMVLARPDQRDTAVCVSLRWSGGLRVVRLPAESWHGLPRW